MPETFSDLSLFCLASDCIPLSFIVEYEISRTARLTTDMRPWKSESFMCVPERLRILRLTRYGIKGKNGEIKRSFQVPYAAEEGLDKFDMLGWLGEVIMGAGTGRNGEVWLSDERCETACLRGDGEGDSSYGSISSIPRVRSHVPRYISRPRGDANSDDMGLSLLVD